MFMKKAAIRSSAIAGLILFVLCVAGSSCKTLEAMFREPVVSLHSVDLTGINLTGVNLLCKVNVENPNPIDIPFPEIDWELFINTNSFLSGMVENKEAIKSRGTTVVNVPVSLTYAGLLNTLKSFKDRKDADYQINLGLRFLLPVVGERVWNFEHQGTIPLVQMIALRNPSFKIEGLDFTGVSILCSADVDNPNPFPIPFPDMDYNYAIRSNNFITSTVEHPGPLAAQALTPVNIRLRVVYSDLYRSIVSLGAAGEAASLLSLSSLISLPGFENERFALDIPGNLPLLKVPTVSFRGITVKNISLSKIDFEFGWDVDNPNSFNLGIQNLNYDFLVNNSRWTGGTVTGTPVIVAGRKTAIPVTVSINSSSMVKDLTGLITRGTDVAYDLNGNLAFSSSLSGFSDPGSPFRLTGRTRLRP
jgi:LEA14-like dessication related protein